MCSRQYKLKLLVVPWSVVVQKSSMQEQKKRRNDVKALEIYAYQAGLPSTALAQQQKHQTFC